MTISDALAAIERSRPGILKSPEVISVLSSLDSLIYNGIYKPCMKGHFPDFEGYAPSVPGSTKLLLPDEFSDVYIYRLEAYADYSSGETVSYNNSSLLFNSRLDEFVKRYAASHRKADALTWRF